MICLQLCIEYASNNHIICCVVLELLAITIYGLHGYFILCFASSFLLALHALRHAKKNSGSDKTYGAPTHTREADVVPMNQYDRGTGERTQQGRFETDPNQPPYEVGPPQQLPNTTTAYL